MLNFEFEKKFGDQSINVKGILKDDNFGISIEDTIFSDSSVKLTGNFSDISNLLNAANNDIDETKLIPVEAESIKENKKKKKKSYNKKNNKKS